METKKRNRSKSIRHKYRVDNYKKWRNIYENPKSETKIRKIFLMILAVSGSCKLSKIWLFLLALLIVLIALYLGIDLGVIVRLIESIDLP